ncbi:MAG: DNA cytosine methyltransferase [Candidatus Woesearchaeota archaeon]
MSKYSAVDLFCGAGGFSKGFAMTEKFNIIKGFDIDKEALKTYNMNHKSKGIRYDLREDVPDSLKNKEIDFVIGSPPCQGFSDAKGSRDIADKRNNLVFHFIRWVGNIKPKIAVMENVSGLLTISDNFIKDVRKQFKSINYKVKYTLLNSQDFGVPQKRKRAIFIAAREDMPDPYFPGFGPNTSFNMIGRKVTVGDAILDLPEPNSAGTGKYSKEPENMFQKIMRKNSTKIYNHISEKPRESEMFIVEKIPEGKMYRSTRFGKKYIGVWELFKKDFSYEERLILWFIARFRGRKAFKATDKAGPDYIPEDIIIKSLHKSTVIEEGKKYGFNENRKTVKITKRKIRKLQNEGWLRTKMVNKIRAYDLNTKSGIRPRYMRLNHSTQSNTILTTDFTPREKLHPTENRGISLREGARIQSFPDDFMFAGDFKSVARQIGNAVPPLMAKGIAEHMIDLLENQKELVSVSTG